MQCLFQDVEVEEIDEEIRLDDELDGEDASPNQQLDVNVNKNLIDLKREELAGGDSEVKPAVIDHEDAALNQHKEAVKVSGDEDIKIEEGETKIAKQENEDEDEEEFEYPDTNIELHHVTGDVYVLFKRFLEILFILRIIFRWVKSYIILNKNRINNERHKNSLYSISY